jgi:hypothetical protein
MGPILIRQSAIGNVRHGSKARLGSKADINRTSAHVRNVPLATKVLHSNLVWLVPYLDSGVRHTKIPGARPGFFFGF